MGGLAKKLIASAGQEEKIFSDDVFSTYLYTGNGSTQTINNGIDLAGKGGMTWFKWRTSDDTALNHAWFDTNRGVGNFLSSNNTAANTFQALSLTAFNSNGFSLGQDGGDNVNRPNTTYASWTFRKAPKFFDVVTYTGNGVAGRQIPHNLGVAPGMIVVKCISGTGDWHTLARGANDYRAGNTTNGSFGLNSANIAGSGVPFSVADAATFDAAKIKVATWPAYDVSATNAAGQTYVAYLFAHDPSEDGIIQCGSYVGNGQLVGQAVTLGWEPQYLLVKNASAATGWHIMDSMRGLPVGAQASVLWAELASQELTPYGMSVNAQGFSPATANGNLNTNGSTYIYMAIRRPNKPPKSGTEVYNAIARTGTGAAATVTGVGFAPDFLIPQTRTPSGSGTYFFDKLRGVSSVIYPWGAAAEFTQSDVLLSFNMNGVTVGADTGGYTNKNGDTYINHFLRRAPGFMDVVCYTGDATASRTVTHNLTAIPDLMIVKARSGSGNWYVWYSPDGTAILNSTGQGYANDRTTFGAVPTASVFTCDNADVYDINAGGVTYVAYLFASCPGIQWINSYVGDGTTGRVINCGFTTGARFVMVKATSTTGSWWIFDSVRGIVSAADPALQLNSTAAEVTSADAIDPHSSGFIVNQEATCSLNASGVNYLVWAIA